MGGLLLRGGGGGWPRHSGRGAVGPEPQARPVPKWQNYSINQTLENQFVIFDKWYEVPDRVRDDGLWRFAKYCSPVVALNDRP